MITYPSSNMLKKIIKRFKLLELTSWVFEVIQIDISVNSIKIDNHQDLINSQFVSKTNIEHTTTKIL